MKDVLAATVITLPNSGTPAQRKHLMTGDGGRVLVTIRSSTQDLVWALNEDAAVATTGLRGPIPPGVVERELVVDGLADGSYLSFYSDSADVEVIVQEVTGVRESGPGVYGGASAADVAAVKTAVDLTTAAVEALDDPTNAFVNVDTTNVGAGPTYYPGATGITLDGYKNLSFSGKIIEGDAEANTLTVQVTDDEDTAGADWQTVYFFDNISNSWVASYSCNATTTQMAASLDGLNFRYVRFKFVGGASATNTLIIKARVTK